MLLGGDDTKVIDKGNTGGLNKRDLESRSAGCLAAAVVVAGATVEFGPLALLAGGLAYIYVCLQSASTAQPSQSIGGYKTRNGGARKTPYPPPKKPAPSKPKGVKTDANGNQIYGRCVRSVTDLASNTSYLEHG